MMNSKLCLPKEVNFSQVRRRSVLQAEDYHVHESRWNLRVWRCAQALDPCLLWCRVCLDERNS